MIKIKKIALGSLAIICTMWISTVSAQHKGGGPPSDEKKAEIEAMKVGFITQKLDLTPDEAKVFWPVYNQYQDELGKLRDSHRKERKAAHDDIETMSDKEVEKLVDGEIVFRQTELDILKKYNSQFKSVLPMKKVEKLYRAEEDFKRELLQKLRERQGQGRGEGGQQREERKN